MPTTQWLRRGRLLGAWLVGLYLARMYVEMGWVKFDPAGFWTDAFASWGYPPWLRVAVGVAEVGGGVALLLPWIASYGAILVGAVMAGAWVTRAGDGRWMDVMWISVYLLALLWIGFEWWSYRLRPRPALRVLRAFAVKQSRHLRALRAFAP